MEKITLKEKSKDFSKNLQDELEKAFATLGLTFDINTLEKSVNRSNVIDVDTVITLTGEVNLAEPVIIDGKTVNAYPCALGENGEKIAIRHLLEDHNISDFQEDGEICVIENDTNGEKVSNEYRSHKSDMFDKNKLILINETNVFAAAQRLRDSASLKGLKIRKVYDGYKPITAKKDSLPTSFDSYKVGYKRGIRKQLWQIEK